MLINELKRKLEQELTQKREQQPKDNPVEKLIAGKFVSLLLDSPKNSGVSYQQHLENDTNAVQNASEGGNPMAYKRTKLPVGMDRQGNPSIMQIGGNSEAERFMNGLHAAIESGRIMQPLLPEFVQQIASPATVQPVPEGLSKKYHPFIAYAQDFYARYKGHLRAKTHQTQRGWLNQQCRFFGNEPIEDITVGRIQDYVNSIQENTTDTINKKLTFLSEILASACEDELIAKNPADSKRIKLGDKQGTGIKALPRETVKELIGKIQTADNVQVKFWLALMLYVGMRREELLGLRWEDVDFKNGFIRIERSITYVSSTAIIGPPKTKSSKRLVAMPDELIAVLKEHRQLGGYLIADESGEPLSEYRMKKLRQAVRSYSGLSKLDARQLRHSYASMLHAAGVERNLIGASMGHTNLDTTDGYIDIEQARMKEVRNAGISYVLAH